MTALFLTPIPVAVSACLVGENVRYDGGDKANTFVNEKLSSAFELVPVCPEIFLGVPRPPISLCRVNGDIRAILDDEEKVDVTDKIAFHASASPEVCGYVLKSRSPSCAIDSVMFGGGEKGDMSPGVFTAEVIKNDPFMPLIEEESLIIPERLDSFLEQVVANAGWKTLSEGNNHTPRSLALFHKAYTPGWGEERGEAIDKLKKIVRLAEADDTNFAHTTLRYRTLYTETVRRLPLSLSERAGLLERASFELANSAKGGFINAVSAYKKGAALLSSPLTVFAQAIFSDGRSC